MAKWIKQWINLVAGLCLRGLLMSKLCYLLRVHLLAVLDDCHQVEADLALSIAFYSLLDMRRNLLKPFILQATYTHAFSALCHDDMSVTKQLVLLDH